MKSITIEIKDMTDKDTFLKAASDGFDVYVATQHADQEAIGSACKAVFDQHPGVRMNVPALEGFILQHLGATPATYSTLHERVKLYLEENRGEQGKALLGTQKGKNGGVWRWQDVKPAAAPKA